MIVRTLPSPPPPPPILHKEWVMRFFKNGCNGWEWKFLLEIGGRRVGWFYNGRDGKFLKSLCIVSRGLQTPIFYEDPLYCLPPPFFQIIPPPPTSLSLPTPNPSVLYVVLFLWLNGLSRHIWCSILLNDNMDLRMSSLGTLVLEGPWCVFYATRRQVYGGLTHNVVFYCYSDLISHTQKHTNTQHTQGPVDWHTHRNVYLHHLLCAHSS